MYALLKSIFDIVTILLKGKLVCEGKKSMLENKRLLIVVGCFMFSHTCMYRKTTGMFILEPGQKCSHWEMFTTQRYFHKLGVEIVFPIQVVHIYEKVTMRGFAVMF